MGAELWQFRGWMREEHYAPTSIKAYVGYVRRAEQFLEERGVAMRRATLDDLRLFLATLPPTAESRNLARKGLLAYFRFAPRRGTDNPAKHLTTIPLPDRLPRPLSIDDHARFLDACAALGGMHEVIGMMFALTGCRFTELRTARWHQFELRPPEPSWFIEGKGSGRRGPSTRMIPLHEALVPLLGRWRREIRSPDYLFPARVRSTQPCLSANVVRNAFAEVCAVAGLEGVVPHQLRHTVATVVLERSRDVRAVQELLGHRSLETTQMYTKVIPGRLRAAVSTLSTPEKTVVE